MTISIEELARRAQAAGQRYEEGIAGLTREDGSRRFSEDEHQERLASLRRERDEALNRVVEALDAAEEAARATLAEAGHGDPTAWLSRSELDEANRRRAFVVEDVSALSIADLVERLGAVLRSGDRPSMFLHWRAAERRLEVDREEKRGQLRRRGLPIRAGVPDEGLARACGELRSTLEGEQRRRRAADAEEVLAMTGRARSLVWSLRRGSRSVAGVVAQSYRRPA